jgi:hypothetical protein
MLITAAVARERFGAFSIEELELTEPRADELLVKIVASGMCQTDQHGRDGYYNTPLPAVFGHEGAGVVATVGKDVTSLAPGDHVVISFPWCGACANCRRRAICTPSMPRCSCTGCATARRRWSSDWTAGPPSSSCTPSRADWRLAGLRAASDSSHRQYKHPHTSGLVTVPGKPRDELAPGTLNSILKQAGMKE